MTRIKVYGIGFHFVCSLTFRIRRYNFLVLYLSPHDEQVHFQIFVVAPLFFLFWWSLLIDRDWRARLTLAISVHDCGAGFEISRSKRYLFLHFSTWLTHIIQKERLYTSFLSLVVTINQIVSYSEVVITLDFESSIRRSNRRRRTFCIVLMPSFFD